MHTLTDRMGEDMRLRGFAPKTQQAYRGAITGLATHFARSPDTMDTLSEDELRAFFLDLVMTRQVSRSTLIVYRSDIRFLYEVTLQRTWPVFDLVRPAKRHTLPNVLAVAEVRQPLAAVRDAQARMTGIGISIGVGGLSVEYTTRSPTARAPTGGRRRARRRVRAPRGPWERRSPWGERCWRGPIRRAGGTAAHAEGLRVVAGRRAVLR